MMTPSFRSLHYGSRVLSNANGSHVVGLSVKLWGPPFPQPLSGGKRTWRVAVGTNERRHLLRTEPRPCLVTPLASGWWCLLSGEDRLLKAMWLGRGHQDLKMRHWTPSLSCAGLRWGVGSWGGTASWSSGGICVLGAAERPGWRLAHRLVPRGGAAV